METPLERAAKALCIAEDDDPERLEPGSTPYFDDARPVVDGEVRGGPGFFAWRLYETRARAVLQAIREPSEAMWIAAAPGLLASAGYIDRDEFFAAYRAMIDTILAEHPPRRIPEEREDVREWLDGEPVGKEVW